MNLQADSETPQAVATITAAPIPRRSRSKVLEVVPELAAQLTAKKGKPKMVPTGRWRLNGYYLAGKRVRRFYADEVIAKADLERLKTEAGNVDAKTRYALANSHDLIQDAIRAVGLFKAHDLTLLEGARQHATALTLLAPFGASLMDVVKDYAAKEAARRKSKTIGELAKAYLADRISLKMRKTYVLDLARRLRRFEEHFGSDTFASDITADGIREWLRSLNLSAVSQHNFARNVSGAFTFGKITPNPFKDVRRIRKTEAELRRQPAVFTAKQVSALLTHADAKLVPLLAIGAFAGLRPESEIARLDWRDIDMKARTLFVHADNKTGNERTVAMSDNLFAWLLPHRKAKGKVMPANARKMRVKAMQDAKVKAWPVDVLRHTFATFHVLAHGSVDKTAEQCGHSVEMLKKHYLNREVKHESAKAFWSILPTASATNVVPFLQEVAA